MAFIRYQTIIITLVAIAHAELTCTSEVEELPLTTVSTTKVPASCMLQLAHQDLGSHRKSQSDCPCDWFRSSCDASLLASKRRTSSGGGFGCPNDGALQTIDSGAEIDVKKLDLETGDYTNIFHISKSGPPTFVGLNAAAISHIDSYGYAAVIPSGNPDTDQWVLARFGQSTMQFLQKLPGTKWYSGAMGATGTYYIFSNSHGLIEIPEPHNIPHTTNEVDQLPLAGAQPSGNGLNVGDIVMIDTNIGGGLQTYALGLANHDSMPRLIHPHTGAVIKLDCPDIQQIPNLVHAAWGSGWDFQGAIYFAANKGFGVYEIDIATISIDAGDPTKGSVRAHKVGVAGPVGGNDGLNCLDAKSPFPTNVYIGPGCERFCIDNGCPCLLPAAQRCSVRSCQNCSFCTG